MIVSIQDYGSAEQRRELVNYVLTQTLWHAVENDTGVIVMQVPNREAGALITYLASDPRLNWIEYTVQLNDEDVPEPRLDLLHGRENAFGVVSDGCMDSEA